MSTSPSHFATGTVLVRREVLHGRLWLETPVTVVADDGDVLAVLLEPGAPFAFHDHPFGAHPWSGLREWGGTTVLMLHRAGDAYAVWKFFTDGAFTHWYVNFETPVVRHAAAFDTDDHGLDLIVHGNGRPEWKDVEHLDAMIASGRMTPEQVVGVLHAAAGVSALLREDRSWWAAYDDWTPASFVRPPAPVTPTPSFAEPSGLASVAEAVPVGPAATIDLPALLASPEGRRGVGREVADLIRGREFEGAEAMLAGHLAAHPGPIADACRAAGADGVVVDGWDDLNADLTRLTQGGHRISAVGLDLSNYGDGTDVAAWWDKEPQVEYAAYADDDSGFAFSTASREDLLTASATYPAPWTGRMLGEGDAFPSITGLRGLNGALLLHEADHPWSPVDRGHLPSESVAEYLGWWWLHLRFHQAVARHLAAHGLALTVPVVLGSHDAGPWLVSAYPVDRVADHAAATARILAERAASGGASYAAQTEETVANLRELRDGLKGWGLRNRDKRKSFEEYADARVAVICRSVGLPVPGLSIGKMRDAELDQLAALYRAARQRP